MAWKKENIETERKLINFRSTNKDIPVILTSDYVAISTSVDGGNLTKDKLWSAMKDATNYTTTENGALTHISTQSAILDLFAMGGALRTRPEIEVEQLISKALAEDFLLATKCIFYLRDIRGGQGERKVFRTALKVLSKFYKEQTEKLVPLIPEYGRWDDILSLEDVNFKDYLTNQLSQDYDNDESISLLAKWLPSENSHSPKTKATARALRKYLGFNSRDYRILLSRLRTKINIVETQMSKDKWNEIAYQKVPSKATLKYKDAFKEHDEERYTQFLDKVVKGELKINTKTLFPYEIVKTARESYDQTVELLWKNLPDYTTGNKTGIVVADVSGSMSGLPMDVSVSLAMYFAERNRGIFQNKFITFSNNPTLQEVRGSNLQQKIFNLERAQWDGSTNLQGVFDLILQTAMANKVAEEDLPSTIYIVSDMEFNDCTDGQTNFESIKLKYQMAGYKMPTLVFWNVQSRQNNVPVKQNEQGVVLVSGSSASTFRLAVENVTPLQFMLKTLSSDRYKLVEEKLK